MQRSENGTLLVQTPKKKKYNKAQHPDALASNALFPFFGGVFLLVFSAQVAPRRDGLCGWRYKILFTTERQVGMIRSDFSVFFVFFGDS